MRSKVTQPLEKCVSLRRLPNTIDVNCYTTKGLPLGIELRKKENHNEKKQQEKETSKRKKATSTHPSIVRGDWVAMHA